MQKFRFAAAVALLTVSIVSRADYMGHEWKYFGGQGATDTGSEWFYLPAEATYQTHGRVTVWTESISTTQVVNYISSQAPNESTFAGAFKAKMSSGYIPPVVALLGFDKKRAGETLMMELAANMGSLTPESHTLYDLDCIGRRYRVISETTYDKTGNAATTDGAGYWSVITPDSLVDTLSQLMCKGAK